MATIKEMVGYVKREASYIINDEISSKSSSESVCALFILPEMGLANHKIKKGLPP